MKKSFFVSLFTFVIFLLPGGTAFAHQPYLVDGVKSIIVVDPDISKAYYGNFSGSSTVFHIKEDKPFDLYVGITVPAIQDIGTDVGAVVTKDGKVIAELIAASSTWALMYEPYGGDDYYEGPEFRLAQATGTFAIVVSRPSNTGKYVVAIGEKEVFTIDDWLRALGTLPTLKSEFFDKPAWTAYFNRIGLFMLIGIVCLFIIYTIISELLRKFFSLFQKKKRVID